MHGRSHLGLSTEFLSAAISFDDGNTSESGADVACMAVPWLVSMGFTISFAALFSKILRLNMVMKSSRKLKRVKVTERDVIKPFGVIFGMNFALLLAWTLVDPLRFVRLTSDTNSDETYGACKSDKNGLKAFGIPILIVNFGALVLACIQAYQARTISDEYSESKYLAIAIGSWFEVVLISIPLLVIVDNNPTASYFLKTSMIFIVCMSLLLLMYIPKFFIIRRKSLEKANKEKSEKEKREAVMSKSTLPGTTNNSSTQGQASDLGVGLRIVSVVSPATFGSGEDGGHGEGSHSQEEDEKLRTELAVCKERISQLEDAARHEEKVEDAAEASGDV